MKSALTVCTYWHVPMCRAFPGASAWCRGDTHFNPAVERPHCPHQRPESKVRTLAGLDLRDDRLRHAETGGKLSLRKSALLPKVSECVLDPHRRQVGIHGRGELRIVGESFSDGVDRSGREWHDHRPFFISALTARCNFRRRASVAAGMSSRFFVMPSSKTAVFPGWSR
jgi:hypothetical protein